MAVATNSPSAIATIPPSTTRPANTTTRPATRTRAARTTIRPNTTAPTATPRSRRSRLHRHEAGEAPDPLEPARYRRVVVERKAALLADVGVGEKRDIGQRRAAADEPVARGEVIVHELQRRLSGGALGR